MSSTKAYTPGLAAGRQYELLKELGRGGMGVVHLALSRGPQGFSKLVVLKMMRRDLLGEAELHRMFLEEARISARLMHPNIVHVYEVCEHEGIPTLVMEYLEGQPLTAILRGDGIPAPRNLLLYILTKVLAGLGAAHDLCDYDGTPLNLVHRDASPHNVFVTFDGQVKVLDFGIAKASGSEVETRAGILKGKVRYMSPEQLLHLPQDRRADLFTIGVILWEMLSGRRFWSDISEDAVVSRLVAKQLPPPPPAEANVPADLAAICARATAADVEKRYATAGQLQRDLEDHLSREAQRIDAEDLAVFMHYRFCAEQESAKDLIGSHVRLAKEAAAAAQQESTRVVMGPKAVGQAAPSGGNPSSPAPADAAAAATAATAATAAAATAAASANAAASADTAASMATAPSLTIAVRRTKWSFPLAVLVGVAVLALAVTTGIGAGGRVNPTCEPGLKSCAGTCSSIERPDLGCGGPTCHACSVFNAIARCNASHGCDIAVCYQGFDDCDGDRSNGCEANVRTDPDNCGACGRRCPLLPHAQRGCGDTCTIWRCDPGYRDCNGVVADGCEVAALGDRANCGACGHACGVQETCRDGRCK